MKKTLMKILLSIIILAIIVLASYEFYQYKMEEVLFDIEKIVLLKDGEKEINAEIKVDSEFQDILKNAEYAGEFVIYKGESYLGTCYFHDGIQGDINISKEYGVITILVSDSYRRSFTFKNDFGKVWMDYVKSKVNENTKG